MLELLQKALFALISGFTELIFASTTAHQLLYRTVTGYEASDSLLSLGIHLGCFIALLMHCRKRIKQLQNEKRLEHSGKRRRGRQPDIASLMDIRILNTATVALLLGFLMYRSAALWIADSFRMALVLMVGGAVLFLPRLLSTGNKNGRSFTQMDGLLVGLAGVLGMIPGLSRMGCMYSTATARGAGKSYALELSILLSIPAVGAMLIFDVYDCFTAMGSFSGPQLLGALVAALAAYAGAYMAMVVMRIVCKRSSTVGFAYYSWGLAMFMLLIYLFVS